MKKELNSVMIIIELPIYDENTDTTPERTTNFVFSRLNMLGSINSFVDFHTDARTHLHVTQRTHMLFDKKICSASCVYNGYIFIYKIAKLFGLRKFHSFIIIIFLFLCSLFLSLHPFGWHGLWIHFARGFFYVYYLCVNVCVFLLIFARVFKCIYKYIRSHTQHIIPTYYSSHFYCY